MSGYSSITIEDFRRRGNDRSRGATDGRNFDETQLGAYYRLFQNHKVGAFYGRATLFAMTQDWASVNGTWAWNNTNSRGEDLIIGDVTPLTALEFPGKNWVGEFKI